jgi:hypothetical protein
LQALESGNLAALCPELIVLKENTGAANHRVATRAGFLMSLLLVAGFLWLGVSYFRETERTFSDFI